MRMGAVILAAGSSSRLGRPKQLVSYRHKNLLQHVIDLVAAFHFSASVMVLGARADEIKNQINAKAVTIAHNEQWPEGIASSIRLGVSESLKINPSLDSILFLLSDQPYITTELIQELINTHQMGSHPITASSYRQQIGVPAIFQKQYFQELMNLRGDVGAKKIMMQYTEEVKKVAFEQGYFDIDTEEDVEQLKNNIG